ncbi:molybdopterin synthase [Aureococcus anophagefferens]|uniref:Molybdopterin synthase n=1 Tax=Aureococcus anophagefferens TaxID=44056 RepID=A0ABR1GAA4_AURAN
MPEGESKSKRFRGTVLWYTAKKKMGFIKPDEPDASDIFVHDSDLRPGTALLSEGDAVEYGLAIFRGRNKAVDVILVGDGAPAPPSPAPRFVPGAALDRARHGRAPLSHDEAIAFVTSDDCGAVATFLGVTRDTFEGKRGAAAAAPGPSTSSRRPCPWKKEIYAEGDPAWKQNKEWDPKARSDRAFLVGLVVVDGRRRRDDGGRRARRRRRHVREAREVRRVVVVRLGGVHLRGVGRGDDGAARGGERVRGDGRACAEIGLFQPNFKPL